MHTGMSIADACRILRHAQRKEPSSFTQFQPLQAAHNFNDSQSQATHATNIYESYHAEWEKNIKMFDSWPLLIPTR